MANLFDRLKRGRAAGADESAPADAAVVADAPSADAEDGVRGKDLRRLAEEKAEKAGEKWRREAEARGEIEKEIGGPKGLEPTRYGDWEKAGRCFDF
jgi:hypothetical protein